MEIIFAVLADAANITASGKLNLLGAFQSIYATAVPCGHPQMFLVLMLKAGLGEKGQKQNITVRLVNPEAKETRYNAKVELQIPEAPVPNPEFPIILELRNFQFIEFGGYRFLIEIDGQPGYTLDFNIQPILQNSEGTIND